MLDPQLPPEGRVALAPLRLLRMVRQLQHVFSIRRIVVDDELHRIEHRHAPRRELVQVLAHAVLQDGELDHLVRLGHADTLGKRAKAARRVAAAAAAGERRHARIVPARHVLLLHQLDQPALGQHDVGQVEPRHLDLPGERRRKETRLGDALVEPVVKRPVILELERADRVRDALDAIGSTVRPVVRRIDAPLVTSAMVMRVADAVHHRIAQVDVGRAHVDLRAQHVRAIGVLALAHLAEQALVLRHRSITGRRVAPRLGECAAARAHLVG